MIRVVCVPENADASISLGFVTALQDSYTLKKANNSASLGVGGVGSVSLPFMTGGGESLVKVGSQTIEANDFYDSFFDLVKRFLLSNESQQAQEQQAQQNLPDCTALPARLQRAVVFSRFFSLCPLLPYCA